MRQCPQYLMLPGLPVCLFPIAHPHVLERVLECRQYMEVLYTVPVCHDVVLPWQAHSQSVLIDLSSNLREQRLRLRPVDFYLRLVDQALQSRILDTARKVDAAEVDVAACVVCLPHDRW